MGILLAVTALLSWGLGDFLIQRSARRFGDWIALFYITAFGTVILLPFVYSGIQSSYSAHTALLWGASVLIFFAALLDFEALRVGKISVIEPIYAMEVAVTALMAGFFIHEDLTSLQRIFIISLIIGIFLISTRSFRHFKKIHLEKGVWYAVLATLGMGATNFLFGIGSRETSPLLINWFTDLFITVVALGYLIYSGQLGAVGRDFKRNKRLVLNVSFFDNLAWITFSYATLYIPIAVATGISEGYIVFAGSLGILFNKEKLRIHQWVGLLLAFVSLVLLAYITDK